VEMMIKYEKYIRDEASGERVPNPLYEAYWEGYDDRLEEDEIVTVIMEALHEWGNEGIEKRFTRDDIKRWLKKKV